MPLTTAFLAWLRAIFGRTSGKGRIASVAALVLFGWVLVLSAVIETLVADALGRLEATRSLPTPARVGIGTVVVVAMLAVAGAAGRPGHAATTGSLQSPGPSLVAEARPSHRTVSPPVATPTLEPRRSSSPTPSPSPTTTPTDIPVPTAPPAMPTGPAATLPPATTLDVTDPRGDLRDESGEKGAAPSYQDIARMAVRTANDGFFTGERIYLDLWVAEAPPDLTFDGEVISYSWLFDTNLDGEPEWNVSVMKEDPSLANKHTGWSVQVWSMADNTFKYEGDASFVGDHLLVKIDPGSIQSPAMMQVAVSTESDTFPDPDKQPTRMVTRTDGVPDSQWPKGVDWLMIAPDYSA